jgi:hypothetical protein
MYFIFGYCREVPVEIERRTPIAVFFGIAILLVLLFLFVTFEDAEGRTCLLSPSCHASSCRAQVTMAGAFESLSGIDAEHYISTLLT